MNLLLFVLILGGTAYGVLHGQDIGALREALAQCRTDWLVCAAGCVLLFLLCEAADLHILLRSFGYGIGPASSFSAACIGFFFSSITPSSTGGQPMMVYYLRQKGGVPVSVSSVALLVMALAYKSTIVVCGLVLSVAAPGFLRESLGGMQFLYWIGFLITAGWSAFLMLLVFRSSLARGIAVWLLTVLEELRLLKNREAIQTELELSMDLYRDAAAHLRRAPGVMLGAAGIMLLRRAALFSVTYCVYRAMGLVGSDWLAIAALQAVIALAADMLPLPGGMGITEALFARVYGALFGALLVPGMILSRGIGHYAQLLLCAVVSLAALALLNRPAREDT